ncbi:hypothetical protein ACFCV8_12830 [Streptomyces sp. NPDC056347]|uniref:hypothetical protein n=1 Tax=Streptomyces sp. NPDC056347 TaxID=3345790 RepID=UPI0035D53FAF
MLLALAVWRAGQDADVLVDEMPLDRPLWWLGVPARRTRLCCSVTGAGPWPPVRTGTGTGLWD